MVRLTFVLVGILLLFSGRLAAEVFQGRWKCVALDPSHLALTGDYSEVQDRLFRKRFDELRI